MITGAKRSGISISREQVSLSDRDIIRRYIGIDSFPCSISSPLRDDDDRPSFSMQERGGRVFWKDFGTGDKGSAVMLLARLWHVTYQEALLKIQLDTEGRIPRVSLLRRYNGKVRLTGNSTIKVRTRPWKKWDEEFWKSFGISAAFCQWCNVYPVSHAFFSKKDESGREQTVCVPMDKYAYAYFEWKDGKESIKLYQPYSQTMKWLSKHDSSVWDLWKQAFLWADSKSNEAVILTSSRKDAMCLWENLGIPSMSLQGEGYVPKAQVMKQVFEKFKKVFIWYDNDFKHGNDNPGQDNARKLIAMYPGLINICIPDSYRAKDPSDLYRAWGKDVLVDVWKSQSNRQLKVTEKHEEVQ